MPEEEFPFASSPSVDSDEKCSEIIEINMLLMPPSLSFLIE